MRAQTAALPACDSGRQDALAKAASFPPPPPVGSRSARKASAWRGRMAAPTGHVSAPSIGWACCRSIRVNVLARAHYLPLFSRLGNYDSAHARPRRLGPQEPARGCSNSGRTRPRCCRSTPHPLLRWRMAARRARTRATARASSHVFAARRRPYIDEVRREIADRGAAGGLRAQQRRRGRGAWWGWSDGKLALEWLFFAGLSHHGDAARHLRARLRPHRARAAGRDPGAADAVGRGSAARAAAPVGPRAGRRHRVRPARLLPPRRRRYQGARSPSWSRRASCCRSRSRAGDRPAYLDRRRRASRARSRRGRCWRRSIR